MPEKQNVFELYCDFPKSIAGDFSELEAGQSEIRNKTLAPVFKRLGIIEQRGNGLKLIAEDLKEYTDIELSWKEPGVAFRVIFTNKRYKPQHELGHELQHPTLYSQVMRLLSEKTASTKELSLALGQNTFTHITTNLSAGEIETFYGNRVRSKMRSMFNILSFPSNSKDKRK